VHDLDGLRAIGVELAKAASPGTGTPARG
jgi:hypothetical protein